MSFLLPVAAWLGLLALPIIAFYLLKTRQRRRLVPTLLFWQSLKPKMESSPFWRKLRRWLSLALQLLILALLVAALMHPAFRWESQSPQRLVAILDTSASMAADVPVPGRWQRAREALAAQIDRLRVHDEMAILTAEDPPRILSGWTSGKRQLREALQQASLLPTATNPAEAFVLASELASVRGDARIAIYSDAVWPSHAAARLPAEASLLGPDRASPRNVGLVHFAARRSPVAPGDWQLDAEIVSTDDTSGQLEIMKDGVVLDLVPFDCQAGVVWRKSWQGSSDGEVSFAASLKKGRDDWLSTDNQAECRLKALSPVKILVVGQENPFLNAILDSIPLVTWAQAADFPGVVPEDVDLVVASGTQLPSQPLSSALLLLNPLRSGFWGELQGTLADVPISDLDRNARLLRHTGFGQVAIREAGQWHPASGSAILASSMESPLLFGQWDRLPRWLVVGFDPEKSDFQLRTAFPILMGNLIQSLREEEEYLSAAALLPGRVESLLHPVSEAKASQDWMISAWNWPGWWLVLLLALAFLLAEWALFHRRITD